MRRAAAASWTARYISSVLSFIAHSISALLGRARQPSVRCEVIVGVTLYSNYVSAVSQLNRTSKRASEGAVSEAITYW
jgi:hypothetical protein